MLHLGPVLVFLRGLVRWRNNVLISYRTLLCLVDVNGVHTRVCLRAVIIRFT